MFIMNVKWQTITKRLKYDTKYLQSNSVSLLYDVHKWLVLDAIIGARWLALAIPFDVNLVSVFKLSP